MPRLIAEERATETRPFDPLGVGLLTLALGAAIETLLAGRTSTHVAIGIAGSLGAAALFVLQQRRQERPLLDPAMLAQPAMIAVVVLLITVSIGYWAVLVYLPLFMTSAFGLSAEQTGVVLLAATVPMIFLPPLGAMLGSERAAASSYMPLFLLAAAASLVGVAAAWLLLPRPESIQALRTST